LNNKVGQSQTQHRNSVLENTKALLIAGHRTIFRRSNR
jgi:hypothetical protein